MRTRVYVAGPISKGDLQHNINQAREAGLELLHYGYAPLVPHLICFFAGNEPQKTIEGITTPEWYESDLSWVSVAHAVLRLPGESVGADLEVTIAKFLGIPVFYSVGALLELPTKQEGEGKKNG